MIEEAMKDARTYRCWTEVSLRFGDTDALGHINNTVFSSLLEQGRVTAMFNGVDSLSEPGTVFVIASMKLNYLAEMHFPGVVRVGSKINKFGRTSLTVGQAIFLNGICYAVSEETMVLIDLTTRRPVEISTETRHKIEARTGPLAAL